MLCTKCLKTEVIPQRVKLGITMCMECGERQANAISEQRRTQVAPAYNKGAYQYITVNDLKTIGR